MTSSSSGDGDAAWGPGAIVTKHGTVKVEEPPVVQREQGTNPESHSSPGRTGLDLGVLMPLETRLCALSWLSLTHGLEQRLPGLPSTPGGTPARRGCEKPNRAAFSGPWASVWPHLPLWRSPWGDRFP